MKPDTMELGEERQESRSFQDKVIKTLYEYESEKEAACRSETARKRTIRRLVDEVGEIPRSLLERGSCISDCRIAARDKLASLVADELRGVPMEQKKAVIDMYSSALSDAYNDIPEFIPPEFQSAEFWQVVAMHVVNSE